MQLLIRSENTHVLDVEPTTTIGIVKNQVAALENVDSGEITLYSCSSPLDDGDLVENLQSSVVEVLCGGLLGGKVHGSLARAGKVKGQTPKVEKQEKKKKKTGRAKRRIQYNRRFI
ncbi:40S ribosomal protein S30, putative [Pediculus humanus corporis]|uniref:40S ribosomal protein S30, putative n=1 Tax=Pediculus humanus subsp. corporis TaxID=121224 RepID=E0W2Z6_PEDHC|nr:40S ribosomal protein S30, putative [Pediculus humanus corporis]EEB20002.1 40S ribosomal protein S30, putative [Pediculus humanus corporis]